MYSMYRGYSFIFIFASKLITTMPNQVVYLKNITKVFEMCMWNHFLPSISKLVVPGLHWIKV